ncbi:unnamed protein product [Lactuca saligna]|uniref:Pentacotripeptide-repeat region of PRORP domain-containing protein n=1 Tax=Lactuca saligna TaxID=75948 RepID=A0AA35VAM9_LACSI|nr:unnamed protein product [Lactuca saligna]
MPHPLFSCCNFVKCSLSLRWKSIRSLAYTTYSDVSEWSPDTNQLCHRIEKLSKFKVIETLDQRKRERSSALVFARQLKESGFKHDVETYMAIIRLLCHSGMYVRLNHLFMYVIDENINREPVGFEICDMLEALIEEKLIKAVDVLVKVYASVGRFKEAMHTLSEMKSRGGLLVSTRTCNFVMNELIEWGKVDMVESVYGLLKKNGLIPNVYTYGILMKGYCRKGRLIEAGNLFVNIQSEAGVEPNAFFYGTYIHMLCSIGQTDLAFQRINLWYRKKRDTAKALDIRKEMESRGIKTDDVIVRSMMQRLCGLGRRAKALYKFKGFMHSGVFIDGVTFNMAIDVACKLGRMEDAMGLVEEMKFRKMKPLKMHYRTLIDGYCLRGEPWNALYIFQDMMRNGLRPDSTTYHVLACGGVFLPLSMLFK